MINLSCSTRQFTEMSHKMHIAWDRLLVSIHHLIIKRAIIDCILFFGHNGIISLMGFPILERSYFIETSSWLLLFWLLMDTLKVDLQHVSSFCWIKKSWGQCSYSICCMVRMKWQKFSGDKFKWVSWKGNYHIQTKCPLHCVSGHEQTLL